jgi:hypothetical protein
VFRVNALQELELMEIIEADQADMEDQELKERWKVENLEAANWCLRKLAALKARQTEIDQLAKAEVERITSWQKKQTDGLDREVEFFTGLLEEYHRGRLREDPRAKTITTPYGEMHLRKQQPQWEYHEEQLMTYLKANRPDLVKEKITYAPDKASIKKYCKVSGNQVFDIITGEVIPGVAVYDRAEAFSVKVEVE